MPYKDPERLRAYGKAYALKNKVRLREARLLNREAILEKKRLYREAHRPQLRAAARKRYSENRERLAASNAHYKAANPEKIRAISRAYNDRQVALNRERQRQNPEKFRLKRLAAYASNPEQRRKAQLRTREYYRVNKEKVFAYFKHRGKTHLPTKIRKRLQHRLWSAVTCAGGEKSVSLRELLGCDITFLKRYIEEQFLPWMTWDNYGPKTWHIDHIKPCKSFNLLDVEQQRACFHYSNLRPLSAHENCVKGANLRYA